MRRALLLALLCLPAARGGELIDPLDTLRFRAMPKKGTAELVPGRAGKAVRLTVDKDAGSAFFTSNIRGKPAWDKAAGLSFWVKGEGGTTFGGLQLIFDDDYAVRYDLCFPVRGTEWTKVTAAWSDFVPVLPGPRSKALGLPGGNPPSKVSGVWVGRWWYWRDYPAQSFAIDELRLEEKIDSEVPERPKGPPLARVLAKLKAGKPVTVVTVGDSLTDVRHWANREVAWPGLLKKALEAKYGSKVTVVNPAIGGTQLRQGVALMPRWLETTPEPDLVTFCFGGNDWEAKMRGPQFREACEDAIDRVRRLTKGKADVLILSSVPALDQWTVREELAAACRDAAKGRNAGLADTEAAFRKVEGEAREKLFVRDRVHFGRAGHELTARVVWEAIERGGR